LQRPSDPEARPPQIRATTAHSRQQPALAAAHRALIEQDRSLCILVMDEDSSERQAVAKYLDKRDMQTLATGDWHQAQHQLLNGDFHLAVLDLQPGKHNCLDLIREVRARSEIPLVVIASPQLHEIDRVLALELGADDCIARPVGLRELAARIGAILRRTQRPGLVRGSKSRPRCYRFGGWQFDGRTQTLTAPDGATVPLTKNEHALLVAFLDAPMLPLSREYLLHATRIHEDVFDRTIDVQVLRLRRKLEIARGAPRIIHTERGVGYMFALPVERSGGSAPGDRS
jgi:two-component system OmpR family response regulator